MKEIISEARSGIESFKNEYSFLSDLINFDKNDVLLLFIGLSTYFAFTHFILTNTGLNVPNIVVGVSYIGSIAFALILSRWNILRKFNSLIGFFLSVEVMIVTTTYTKSPGFDPVLIIHGIFFIVAGYTLYKINIK